MLGDFSVSMSNEDGNPAIPVGSFGIRYPDFEFSIPWNLDFVGDLLVSFSSSPVMNVVVGDEAGVRR